MATLYYKQIAGHILTTSAGTSQGANYIVGDQLTISGGNGNAIIQVDSLGASDSVATWSWVNRGSGYTVGDDTITSPSATGSGFLIDIDSISVNDNAWATVANWWTDDPQVNQSASTPASGTDEAVIVAGETIDEIPATMTCSYNYGTITENKGTVSSNNLTISKNSGVVTDNAYSGTIHNYTGTITTNNGGIIYIYSTGTVGTNNGGAIFLAQTASGIIDLHGIGMTTEAGGMITLDGLIDTVGGGSLNMTVDLTVPDLLGVPQIIDAFIRVNSTNLTLTGGFSRSIDGCGLFIEGSCSLRDYYSNVVSTCATDVARSGAIYVSGMGTLVNYAGTMTISGNGIGIVNNGGTINDISGTIENETGEYGIHNKAGTIYDITGNINNDGKSGIRNESGASITTITGPIVHTHTIAAGAGIDNSGSIGEIKSTIDNTGTVAIINGSGGTITTISGTINIAASMYGIGNIGTITTISSQINLALSNWGIWNGFSQGSGGTITYITGNMTDTTEPVSPSFGIRNDAGCSIGEISGNLTYCSIYQASETPILISGSVDGLTSSGNPNAICTVATTGVIISNDCAINYNYGEITDHYSQIVVNNEGTIGAVLSTGSVTTNGFSNVAAYITDNQGSVTDNYGIITTNTLALTRNQSTGIIGTNDGEVGTWVDKGGYNYGIIGTNNGYVTVNGEPTGGGSTVGTITLNKGLLYNNEVNGIVVTNNGDASDIFKALGVTTWGAMILSSGGLITNNFGMIGGTWDPGQGILDQGGSGFPGNYGVVAKHHGLIINNVGGTVHLYGRLSYAQLGQGNSGNDTNWSGCILFINYWTGIGHGVIRLHTLSDASQHALGVGFVQYGAGPTSDPDAVLYIDATAFTDPTVAEVAKDVTYNFEGVTKTGTKQSGGGINGSGILGML